MVQARIVEDILYLRFMNKVKYLLMLCMAGCLAACSKSDDFDQEAQFRKDTTAIRAFVVANNIPAVKDPSGLFYQVIAPGSGSVSYSVSTVVSADYQGRLLDGAIFDDSKGTPISFTLGGVIAGWQIGVPKVQKGGKVRLIMPSYLGYGNSSAGAIAPNSILDFTVTVADVK